MTRFLRAARLGFALIIGVLFLNACSPSGGNKSDASALTVDAIKPQRISWPKQVTANGAVIAWQEAIISAETGPLRVTSIDADVGTWARKGQPLATLARDSVLADQAKLQAQLAQAEANLDKAKSDVRRAENLASSGALSAQQIEAYRITLRTAEASRASARAQLHSINIQLGQTTVRAVDDGVVSSRSALLGKVVNSGDEMFRLIRQGRIEWQAELDSQQLAQVQAGQAAQVTLPGAVVVAGKVRLVAPTLNSNTSRGIVYVEFPVNTAARAGMYASGKIETGRSDVMTVPDTAVVLRDGKSCVFIIRHDNHVQQLVVTTGQHRDGKIEVLGLPPGASIVKAGGAFLADGVTVRLGRSGK